MGSAPLGIGFSADGVLAFVTLPRTDEVVVVDRTTRSVLRRIAVGGSPDGVGSF